MEYGVQACSPFLRRDVDAIERFQRMTTKHVQGLSRLSYEERLEILELFSTDRRRLRGDLVITYCMFTGRTNVNPEEFFSFPHRPNLRGHHYKVTEPIARLQRRANSFAVRTPKYWNMLPAHVVTAPSLKAFKSRLDACWSDVFPQFK